MAHFLLCRNTNFKRWIFKPSFSREDDEVGEELKLDEEPVGAVKEEKLVVGEVAKDENDDVMSKMKKDPDPESYQPIRKRSGPEIQGYLC